MAHYDPELRRLCVRIVYDGPANAGKTTNVRQLAAIFPSCEAPEVISPSEIAGRTLSFDWLEIRAGVLLGFPLVCQVVTVPGQGVLTPRRRYLLESADVVVYVCDAALAELDRAREGLTVLEEVVRERRVRPPVVLQANKQDQVGARPAEIVAAALGLGEVPSVEAIAVDGGGVVDTFVTAVRAVGQALKRDVEAGEIRIPVRRTPSPAALLHELLQHSLDREAAAEMLLREIARALRPAEAVPSAIPEGLFSLEPRRHLRDEGTPSRPTLPRADLPAGHVWPARHGREILSALGVCEVPEVESDRPLVVESGAFVLETARALRFPEPEVARAAVVRAARERTQLGSLLPPETVLALQPAADGASWLWTIHRRRETVDVALARGPEPRLLEALGRAVAALLRVASSGGLAVDLRTSAFAIDDPFRYVGRLGPLADARSLSEAFGRFLEELAAARALDAFLPALDAALADLSSDERRDLEDVVAARGDAGRRSTLVPRSVPA
jgi:signal recognition particle receptor subunit beta